MVDVVDLVYGVTIADWADLVDVVDLVNVVAIADRANLVDVVYGRYSRQG